MAAEVINIPAQSSVNHNDDVDESMFGNDEDDPHQRTAHRHHPPSSSSSIQPLLSPNNAPPPPLPPNWFLKESQSHPGHHYYFNQDSGECVWELPLENADGGEYDASTEAVRQHQQGEQQGAVTQESLNATAAAAAAAVKSILKRSSIPPVIDSSAAVNNDNEDDDDNDKEDGDGSSPPRKKNKSDKKHHHHHRKPSDEPKEVRVLHILKKHAASRRPSSWRVKQITISKAKAMEELRELLAILKEVQESSANELRATFEELARTESDCSSAKRGGDLGFFGKS
ncbi:hypothetical protein HJC23_005429 [Cyclotella cryptica]|uniref:Peptidyl-prolyl cis-trans isomerase n=1 Tax=Cyclotella cryptica TaxID=29204 RepID=A0ABD3NX17_9STRA